MRNYKYCENPMERCEFNWFQWQWIRIQAFFGWIPTHKEEAPRDE